MKEKTMISMIYAAGAYAVFLLTFLYAIGFTGEIVVPKSINSGDAVPLTEALAVNTVLLATFAIQHSLMARPFFKRWWTQLVPQTIERSTYVLFASAALILLFWQWRPLSHVVWELRSPIASPTLQVVFWLGWGLVLVSTFLISHFELFGLRQAVMAWLDRKPEAPVFRTPMLYKHVRHPIYLGFLLAFWATPVMTVGHLLFAIGTTGYILIGIRLEGRDLIALFGEHSTGPTCRRSGCCCRYPQAGHLAKPRTSRIASPRLPEVQSARCGGHWQAKGPKRRF
jgi:methanethiol S-methyltransferase